MVATEHALYAASRAAPARGSARAVLLAGAGGTLGSAVLEHLLACGAFAHVRVLVDAPVAPAMRAFDPLPCTALQSGVPACADTGVIVFDRERDVHGREAAFHRPQPEALPPLARALHDAGVRRLIVVLPHAPALLPGAFRAGLASLDEQAVAAIGFEQFVLVRSARKPAQRRAAAWPQRVADTLLAQLHWMVPQREQPVRAAKVAAFVAALAQQLPRADPGARVASAELLWQAAQVPDPHALVLRWLDRQPLPEASVPAQRW